jgi:ribonuclease J
VEEMVLRDRLRLAHDGIVLILLAIDKLTGTIVSGPEIISRGFVFEDASQEIISNVRDLLTKTIKGLDRELLSDSSLLKAKLRSTLKKYLRDTMERRPMIMPIIIEV